MSKLGNVRVIEILKFRVVSSGLDMFDSIFSDGGFDKWIQANNKIIKNIAPYDTPDFMWHDGDKNVWIFAI